MIILHEAGQLTPQSPLTVHGGDRGTELRLGNDGSEALFEHVLQRPEFLYPIGESCGGIGFLRQLQHMDRTRFGHEFDHFLLAIAGGLGHHQVGHFKERVGLLNTVAERGFDQRAKVGR